MRAYWTLFGKVKFGYYLIFPLFLRAWRWWFIYATYRTQSVPHIEHNLCTL